MQNDDLNRRVTERIQEQLVAILPEEDIREHVDMVIDTFFSRSAGKESAFDTMVRRHLEERTGNLLKTIFSTPDWGYTVDENLKVHIGAALQAVLKIDPDALKDVTAKIIAMRSMRDFMYILTGSLQNNYNFTGPDLATMLMRATEDYLARQGGGHV